MGKTITSHLLAEFDRTKIDQDFDFFFLTTNDKHIARGAYALDKPNISLKALAVAFDGGRSAFLMFRKNAVVSKGSLLEAIGDEKLSINPVFAGDIKDYILLRLFLFSLSNFSSEELSYNNLTGRLYVFIPNWIAKNKKSLKALEFDVDKDMNLQAGATTFTAISLFSNKKVVAGSAKYTFSFSNHSLKRVLSTDETDDLFIHKTLGDGKTELPFLTMGKDNLKRNKAYCIFRTLDLLKERYSGYLHVDFETIDRTDQITMPRETRIDELCAAYLRFQKINCVNFDLDPADEDYFKALVVALQDHISPAAVTVSAGVDPSALNVLFMHDEAFYEANGYVDPHKNLDPHNVTQCVTKEDVGKYLLEKKDAIIITIMKELLIKSDILRNKTISLDRWEDFHHAKDWIFGIEKNGIQYFMSIHPDGSFMFESKREDFEPFENLSLYPLSEVLDQSEDKTKSLISDGENNVLLISKTGKFLLPDPRIFTADSIRSLAGRETYLSGLTDINFYETSEGSFYSVGPIGAGMQGKMENGVLLYQTQVAQGQDITKQLLQTMSVTFVKYHEFTVLPYPLKYLREYAEMEESLARRR